jgi:hypothetical protein
MSASSSKRARLLKEVLHYIDADDWAEYPDFLVFGRSAFDRTGSLPNTANENVRTDEEIANEFTETVKHHHGRALSQERTSLQDAPELPVKRMAEILTKFSPERLQEVRENLSERAFKRPSRSPQLGHEERIDALDAHYAQDLVSKLGDIVRRATSMDPVALSREPSPKIRRYFAEVHDCFLYGGSVACAVLCRALLESALIERIDPDGRVLRLLREERKLGKAKGQERSYFQVLIRDAEKQSVLTDDRPFWAKRIKDAGDTAIHNLREFDEKYGGDGEMAAVVDNTRKVLEDLYSSS